MSDSRLGRLLDRAAVSKLLESHVSAFGSLDTLSLFDVHCRHVAGQPIQLPQDVSRLWEHICGGEAFLTSDRNLAVWPITNQSETYGILIATGLMSADLYASLALLVSVLRTLIAEGAAKRAIAEETLALYRELNVLYNIGNTLGAGLELEATCRRVLDESMKLTGSLRGAVLLVDDRAQEKGSSALTLSLIAQSGLDELPEQIVYQFMSLALNVARNGEPSIVNDFRPQGLSEMPVVCAPLRFQNEILGVVLLTEKAQGVDFIAADEKLLYALASQAANSIENARLLDDVKKQRDEISTVKSHMDNIFASIASGVITMDKDDVITSYNRAAQSILNLPVRDVLDRPYQQALGFLSDTPLPALIADVRYRGNSYLKYKIDAEHPRRGHINLEMSLTQLRDTFADSLGVAMVIDDVTEARKIERERRMVRRYLPPELLDALPSDLNELKLQGERQVITTLFADIRGFTSFSEVHDPEKVVEVVNYYFALAGQGVREHGGIVDKYLGDAVMALFNTPLLRTESHAWDAVQAAWQIKMAIDQTQREAESGTKLSFGMGICTGEAVVGNVGTIDRMEYTAIGDGVNVAKRLQERATAGQIVMSRSTWEQVKGRVRANPLPTVTLKGRRSNTDVFELVALLPDAAKEV
jgi:adenylate cyclase